MTETFRCSKCGRGYDDPIPRNLCMEMHKAQHRHHVGLGSRTWDAGAIRWVIHSLAVEGPRRVIPLTDKYQIVCEDDELEKVEVEVSMVDAAMDAQWVQADAGTEEAIITAYYRQPPQE